MSQGSLRARPAVVRLDPWLAGLVAAVAVLVAVAPGALPQLAIAGLGVAAAVVVARWPGVALGGLLVLLPVQNLVFARLLAMGAPPTLVGALTNVKELVVVVLAAVAAREVWRDRTRLEQVDRVVLAYLVLLAAYVVVPTVLDPVVGRIFPQAPGGLSPRLQAFRTDALFLVLFLAARHLPAAPAWRDRLERGIVWLGVLVAGAAVVEYLAPTAWETFTLQWAQVDRFAARVLGSDAPLGTTTVVTGTGAVRAGSVLLQPLQLGFYLLLPLALGVRRIAVRVRPTDLAAVALIGTAIVLTFTRSAVLAAVATVVLVPWALPRAAVTRRFRAGAFATVLAVGGTVLAAATVLSQRIGAAVQGDDPSATGHVDALVESIHVIAAHPLGLGLATAPSVPDRFGARYVVSENAVLQIGVEAGVVTMLVFVVALVVVLDRLFLRARGPGDHALAAAAATAGVGLLVGAMFLHVWTNIPTALTYFAVAGVALNPAVHRPAAVP